MMAVLLPVTGKAAESLKHLLEKPSNPEIPTKEQIQKTFELAHSIAIKNKEREKANKEG